jgi:hypothetical protein
MVGLIARGDVTKLFFQIVAAKEKNKEGLPCGSPSIVFTAAVALIGRPPQRRQLSSYKAPAHDNETLDHLLSIVESHA